MPVTGVLRKPLRMETMTSLALDYNQLQAIPDCLGMFCSKTCPNGVLSIFMLTPSVFLNHRFWTLSVALQPRVTTVTLSHNQFTSTPSLGSTVTWLDLSWNRISVVDENVSQLVLLKHLDMRHNRLTPRSLPDLSDLTFLEYLDVSENMLTSYPRLAPKCPLKVLKVGCNLELGDPHDGFGPFPFLEEFSCTYTRLKIFPKFLMNSNKHLHTLNISHTHISRLPMKLNFPRLTTLYLSATQLIPSSESSAEIHDLNWRPPAEMSDQVQASLRGLAHLHATTTLHLSGIGLFHLPPSMFEVLPASDDTESETKQPSSEKALNEDSKSQKDSESSDTSSTSSEESEKAQRDERSASISVASPGSQLPLSATLTRLYFRWNNLFTLPEALFSMVQLECLDVLGNKLEQLSPSIALLTNLRHLSLGHNRLQTLPIEITQLTSLETLVLEHNVWEDPALDTLFWATNGVSQIFDRLKQTKKDTLDLPYLKTLPELTGSAEEQLKDRVLGVIFGMALGDAIGLCTEFMTHTQATYACGADELNPLEMVRDRHRVRWLQGDWTDDTDQAILLIENLIQHSEASSGLLDIESFAHSLLQWANDGFPELGDDGGMGIGQTVANVLRHPAYLSSPRFASKDVWLNSGCNVAANGALMRCAPLALFGFWESFDADKQAERAQILNLRHAKFVEEDTKAKEASENAKGEKVPSKHKSEALDKKQAADSKSSKKPTSTPSSPVKTREEKPGSSKKLKNKDASSSSIGGASKASSEGASPKSIKKKKATIGDSVSSLELNAGLVRQNTLDACEVTHCDPRCVASCLALNMAIVAILRGERDMETILNIAFEEGNQAFIVPPIKGSLHTAMYADWQKEFRELIFTQQLDQLDLSDASRMGYTFKGLGTAFATLRTATDFERAMIKITLCGGDADTNGAIAGGLLGAVVGYRGLPQKWLSVLPHFDWLHSRTSQVWDHVRANVFPEKTEGVADPDASE